MTTAMDRMLFADEGTSEDTVLARANRVVSKRTRLGPPKAVIPDRQSSWNADGRRKIRAQSVWPATGFSRATGPCLLPSQFGLTEGERRAVRGLPRIALRW